MKSILTLDARLSDRLRLNDHHTPPFRVAAIFAHSGDSWFWLAGLILAWFIYTPGTRSLVTMMAAGLVFLAALVLAIKFLVGRKRPEGEWGAIYRNTDPHSFPSGHASRAALLTVIAFSLGPLWLGWLLLVWTPLMSISRVATGVHYFSDIVAGLLLGAFIGSLTLAVYPLLASYFPFAF